MVLLLTLCLAAGAVPVMEPAYAATSPYVSGSFNHRYPDNLIVNGVDISAWQDPGSLSSKNTDFAILRVTYTTYGRKTLTMYNDKYFANHYNDAKKAGIMMGVYVFSQATNATEGAQEAQFAINRLKAMGIGPKDLSLPLYMDYEFAGGILGRMHGINKTAATNAAVAFCNTVKAAGYTPGIYASTTFFNNYIDMTHLAADVDIWCAQYYKTCQLPQNYSKWQYTSSAKVKGIGGKCDANFWYINKKVASSPVTTIKGINKTNDVRLSVYNGGTKLKEGVDYNIGRISMSGNYAYIKGIGKYAGYALVPLTGSSSNVNQDLGSITANYMTAANGQMSTFMSVPAVVVKATKIKKLKGKKQKFYIKVAKKAKANASGYQVKYSRNSDMSESVIKTIGKKYNKTSNNIRTNARKRYYYVQVRTYKDSGGIRYYSSWSATKRVKVK